MKRLTLLCLLTVVFLTTHSQVRNLLDYQKLAKQPAYELLKTGDYYMKQNNLDTALGYYIVLVGKYNLGMNRTDKYLCVVACNLGGQIYFKTGNYSKAFDLYLKGLQICEQNDIQNLLPELYKNTGNVYASFRDFERAADCYNKGLQFARKQKNLEIEVKILNNLTSIYCFMDRIEDAKKNYKEMVKHLDFNIFQRYFYYLDQGQIYEYEEKYDSAIICYKKTAEYAVKAKLESQYKSSSYTKLAKLYEKNRQNDSALHYLLLNVDTAKSNIPMHILSENLKALVRIYTKSGDHKKSLLYKSRYWEISDSVFSVNEFNRMKNSQFVYEMSKNFREIESLSLDKERNEIRIKNQREILIIISVSLFLLCILLIIVYFQKKKLSDAYTNLFRRNTEFIKSDQLNKKLRQEYEHKEEKKQIKKTMLLFENQETVGFSEIMDENTSLDDIDAEDSKNLYSANKLTSEQKELLLNKINEVMEYTNEFCNKDFGLERLASLIGSNSRYVSQVINDTYNKNFRTYVNEYRIKEAQLRLMDTQKYGNYTIKAISESIGYKSPTNFVSIFKKITGITPSLYQKMAKENR